MILKATFTLFALVFLAPNLWAVCTFGVDPSNPDCHWERCCDVDPFQGLEVNCITYPFPGGCPNVEWTTQLDCQDYLYPACVGATCLECCYDQQGDHFNCTKTQLTNDVPVNSLYCRKWNAETQTYKWAYGPDFTICDW